MRSGWALLRDVATYSDAGGRLAYFARNVRSSTHPGDWVSSGGMLWIRPKGDSSMRHIRTPKFAVTLLVVLAVALLAVPALASALPSATVSGQVTNSESGLPVAGATVELWEYDRDLDEWYYIDEVMTGGDGIYAFYDSLTSGFEYGVDVYADDYDYFMMMEDEVIPYTGTPLVIDVELTPLSSVPFEYIEHDAAGVTFDRWVTGYSDAYTGGGYVYGRWSGTRLDAKFTGDTVYWVGPMQPSYGKADVYIDNVKVTTVDCYASSEDATEFAILFESDTLSDGPHTLSIRLTGAKNPASSGNVVVVDMFVAEGAKPTGGGIRIDEKDGVFGGSWVKATNPTYYGKSYAYSRWSSASWKMTFEGTRVAWVGPKTTSYGRAKIYIDGVYKGTVSQYGTTGWRNKVWESPVLTLGTHTIEIKPTGTKDAASKGTNIVIDAIDVTP
jgi:hypothetical protein